MKYEMTNVHHRAYIVAKNIFENEEKIIFIYNKKENIDDMRNLVYSFLVHQFGLYKTLATQAVKNINFVLDENKEICDNIYIEKKDRYD